MLGVVVDRAAPTHEGRLVPLAGVVDVPAVPAELLELAGWMARYYLAPVAACLRLVLPPGGGGALRRADDGGWVLAPPPGRGAERLVARLTGSALDGLSPRRREVAAVLERAGGRLPAARLCADARTTMPTLRAMAARRRDRARAGAVRPGRRADRGRRRGAPPGRRRRA